MSRGRSTEKPWPSLEDDWKSCCAKLESWFVHTEAAATREPRWQEEGSSQERQGKHKHMKGNDWSESEGSIKERSDSANVRSKVVHKSTYADPTSVTRATGILGEIRTQRCAGGPSGVGRHGVQTKNQGIKAMPKDIFKTSLDQDCQPSTRSTLGRNEATEPQFRRIAT